MTPEQISELKDFFVMFFFLFMIFQAGISIIIINAIRKYTIVIIEEFYNRKTDKGVTK